ncbi:MAG: hemolysin family protein [Planctomycetota bacterium]|nr:hemolysin family protein [Planctomycetota bacterium]
MISAGWMWFWVGVLATIVGGVLGTLFHALRDVARSTLEDIIARENNPRRSRRVSLILDDVDAHATAVGLPRIACNVVVSVACVFWVANVRGTALPQVWDIVIGLALATLTQWVFGLIIPAAVARHAGEQAIYDWSRVIRGIHGVLGPLRVVVRFFDEVVRRLTGRAVTDEAEELEEELMSVVEEGRQEGQFDKLEQQMIEAAVRFRDTTVAQIMTPRTEMESMEMTDDLSKITAYIRAGGHSRIPVYEGSVDRIAGIFYVKDLMRWLAGEGSRGGKMFRLRQILRPAYFVPESKTVRELLHELLDKRVHIAMVADEFGGTAGLVTFEDIVEEVFGDIQDEYERAEENDDVKTNVQDRTAEIDARAYIKDANAELRQLGIELPESEDYDTVGGLVTVTLGRIPAAGETLRVGRALLTVLEAEPTRVVKVRLAISDDDGEGTLHPEAHPPEQRETTIVETVLKTDEAVEAR